MKVVGLPGSATAVAAGVGRACAVVAGEVFCWGENLDGRVGNGANGEQVVRVPAKVRGLEGVVTELALGDSHSCALSDAGVQCWGGNDAGELGGEVFVMPSADPRFVRARPKHLE